MLRFKKGNEKKKNFKLLVRCIHVSHFSPFLMKDAMSKLPSVVILLAAANK